MARAKRGRPISSSIVLVETAIGGADMPTPQLGRTSNDTCSASGRLRGPFAAVPANAQQVTGTLGSPNATTTIDGRYLPPPPQPFEGTINLNALQSKQAWQRVSCRQGARQMCS